MRYHEARRDHGLLDFSGNEIFQSSSSMYKKSYGSKLAMQYLEQGAHFKGDFAVSLLIGEVVRILKRW